VKYSFRNEVYIDGELFKFVLKTTATGKALANLTVVTKHRDATEWHRVVAWQDLAEKAQRLQKGDFIRVFGRLQTRSWDDRQSGEKRYITEVVAIGIDLPGGDEPMPLTPHFGGEQ